MNHINIKKRRTIASSSYRKREISWQRDVLFIRGRGTEATLLQLQYLYQKCDNVQDQKQTYL